MITEVIDIPSNGMRVTRELEAGDEIRVTGSGIVRAEWVKDDGSNPGGGTGTDELAASVPESGWYNIDVFHAGQLQLSTPVLMGE